MDFFDKTGKMAIGSRLRLLTDRITADATDIYRLYGNDFKPKWFPVFFVLADGEAKTVTSIAHEIGHSLPSVSNIVKDMKAHGLIADNAEHSDGRCNLVRLSKKGIGMTVSIRETCDDVASAVDSVCREAAHDLWRAIDEWERLLAEKSLLQRVKEARKIREKADIAVIPYEPHHKELFKSLNEQWITQYWQIEPHDLDYLDHPQEYIIDKGGFIFVAVYKGTPVGVCALCKMDDPKYDYELAKLAVCSEAQGKGIGTILCKAAIEKAKETGAKALFLESNTLLRPAIHTYRKLGFRELAEYHPAYERGNIQMELILK